jgi:hypothetical protein
MQVAARDLGHVWRGLYRLDVVTSHEVRNVGVDTDLGEHLARHNTTGPLGEADDHVATVRIHVIEHARRDAEDASG